MINICFHGIGTPRRTLEPGEDRYWITASLYDRVLDEVAGRDDVALSFDDGNASDVEIGLVGLRSRGLVATFFVLAGRLDHPGSLTGDQVGRLRDEGMRVGTHGMDHVSWRAMPDDQVHRELVEARQRLAELAGSAVDEAALPMGQYDRRTLARLRGLAYRRVHTSDRLAASAGDWLQPRFSVRADDTLESLRAQVLTPQPRGRALRARAKTIVKRLR